MEKIKQIGGGIIVLAVIGFWLLGSSNGSSSSSGRYNPYDDSGSDAYDNTDPAYEVTRDNWNCTGDCSGHEAGYEWASDQGISDPEDCSGNSDSFIEGCQAYANEQRIEAQQEYDQESAEENDYPY